MSEIKARQTKIRMNINPMLAVSAACTLFAPSNSINELV